MGAACEQAPKWGIGRNETPGAGRVERGMGAACEQAPKQGIKRKETSASRASGARYGSEKERKKSQRVLINFSQKSVPNCPGI